MSSVAPPGAFDAPRVLMVTNDFPPRVGGVQQYEWNIVRGLDPSTVAVLAPSWPGWREHDAAQPFAVHRWPPEFLWPSGELERRVRQLIRDHRAEVVLFGHGLPLSLLGPRLAATGTPYVTLTHGVELWQARLPGLSAGLRRALSEAREVTALGAYTARAIRRAVPSGVRLSILSPAVDPSRFSPQVDGSQVRARLGLGADVPVALCVSRLVERKGQDVLIQGMPLVRSIVPNAVLVIAGGGPDRSRLEVLAAASAPAGSVVFAGEVPDADLPELYAACDVFAMPCRSRWGGLEVEGFGIVFLEAAATGKAVIAGRSGGAVEAVEEERTGLVVEGREVKAVALAVAKLLKHRDLAARFGAAGRARVEASFTWPQRSAQLAEILSNAVR